MPKLLELIEQKAVPENVLQSAASGELPMPPEEAIAVLVRLTRDEKFGAQARETLKRWDANSITTAIAHPAVTRETVKWALSPDNPCVINVVTQLAKGSVDPKGLEAVMAVCPGQVIPAFLTVPRFRETESLLQKLLENPELPVHQATLVRSHLSQLRGEAKLQAKEEAQEKHKEEVKERSQEEAKELKKDTAAKPEENKTEAKSPEAKSEDQAKAEEARQPEPGDEEAEKEANAWVQKHAAEIAAEEGTEFALVGGLDGLDESGEAKKVDLETLKVSVQKGVMDESRLSTIQKLTRMPVSLRIQQAMKGTREERAVLIRDSSRLVCLAVLASPKLSAQEVEGFASMKNVRDEVLRELVRNRKFRKNYIVTKNLCNNPKTPLDMTLTLINELHANDLRGVAMNKNVPDTIRKMAQKKFQDKVSGRR